MNIRFLSIELQNFRSIDMIKINLENQGTVIVKGINEYEDNASSNGSGKSSIFEGIIYALFEETSSGEKNVENRIINNGFTVVLKFNIDGINYKIQREGKNNKSSVILYKNNEDISARNKSDTNKLILDILGISKSVFLDSIFLSQNAITNLASLSPTARRERLEVLTNTDYIINKFKEEIKQQQINYESLCVDDQMNINKLQGELNSIYNQKQDIEFKINEINEQIKQRDSLGNITDIDNKIQNLQHNLIHIPERIKELETCIILEKDKQISQLREQGKDNIDKQILWNNKITDKRTEYNDKLNELDKINLQINQLNKENQQINQQIEDIKNSDKCPTCGRKYENSNEQHIKDTINKYNLQIEENNTKIASLQMDIDNINNQIDAISVQGKNLKEELENITKSVTENQNEINNIESKKAADNQLRLNLQSEKTNIENNISQLRDLKEKILSFKVGNKEEFEKMLLNINEKILDINKNIETITNQYNENNNIVNSSKHILQLITKDFRTYLLQNSLKYLNKVLNDYSNKLFSNNGDIIQIDNNDTKLEIKLGNAPYESLSGGERTRVNIALLLAQKSLANMIGNISCNVIILDEILGYCDNQAEINVINLITSELESLETIYMISHKEIPIGYDSELIVIKDRNGLTHLKSY